MNIYLYVKQCTHCGLKYFGKTVNNPFSYIGSGTYWKYHVKKHGIQHIITTHIFEFDNQNECTKFALNFSHEHDIIESMHWANLCDENGKGGCIGYTHSEVTLVKMRNSLKLKSNKPFAGKTHTDKSKNKIRDSLKNNEKICGKNNHRSKAILCTNDGNRFNSITEASNYYGIKNPISISHVLSGKNKTAKGLTFILS